VLILIILGVLGYLALMMVISTDAGNRYDTEQDWIQSEHTCPKCNWTGYGGAMKIISGGVFGVDKYYCPVPECGYQLGEW